MKMFNVCTRISQLHSYVDIDYTKTPDFKAIGYHQFFMPLFNYNDYVRRHLKETIAKLNVRGEFRLIIGSVCNNQISLIRNKQRRYSLCISDSYSGENEIIALSGINELFSQDQLSVIMTRLNTTKYQEDLYYKHFDIIRSNIAKSLEVDKPSFIDKLLKRPKNISFDSGGYLEGKWIEASYTASYGLWGGIKVEGECNYYVGMINTSMFSEIHTPVHRRTLQLTFGKDLKSLATHLAKNIASQVCQELGPKY